MKLAKRTVKPTKTVNRIALRLVVKLVESDETLRQERGHVIGHLFSKALGGALSIRCGFNRENPLSVDLTSTVSKKVSAGRVKVCKSNVQFCKHRAQLMKFASYAVRTVALQICWIFHESAFSATHREMAVTTLRGAKRVDWTSALLCRPLITRPRPCITAR